MFGGFALRANSLGHLEQIAPGAPNSRDKHGFDLLSNDARDSTPAEASDLNPGQVALPKDGGLYPAPQDVPSSVIELNIGLTFEGAYDFGPPIHIRL